ncbi:MAG: sulfotransferase domain-containing protein [Bacteroidetes bacterium]|nr:sulfotransferase domain-containing protein [Bacteroidota bacterium]
MIFKKYNANVIYLASYPKSGNTWVRFIIANIYNQLENKVSEVTFHNVQELIPETGVEKKFGFNKLPEVVKTHDRFKKGMKKTILIVRNPIDVANSYYHYLVSEKQKSVTFNSLLKDADKGLSAICAFATEYINSGIELKVLTYENLHSNSVREIKSLTNFLGIEVSQNVIEKAIELSSFNSMRKVENEHGRPYAKTDFKFTRLGVVGDGLAQLNDEDKLYAREILSKYPVLDLLYRDTVE